MGKISASNNSTLITEPTLPNSDLCSKLDLVVRLLAAIYTKGSNKTDAIIKLSGLQISPKEIAEIVGVSNHHASQVIYRRRKGEGNKRGDRPLIKEDSASDVH